MKKLFVSYCYFEGNIKFADAVFDTLKKIKTQSDLNQIRTVLQEKHNRPVIIVSFQRME